MESVSSLHERNDSSKKSFSQLKKSISQLKRLWSQFHFCGNEIIESVKETNHSVREMSLFHPCVKEIIGVGKRYQSVS